MISLLRTLALFVLAGSASALAQTSTPLLPSDDGLTGPQNGIVVAADTHRVAVGMPNAFGDQGAVFVFDRAGDTWTQTATLVADDAGPGRFFGLHVALDGDAVVTSSRAMPDPVFGVPTAEVYRFELVSGLGGDVWDQRQKINISGGFDPISGPAEAFVNSVEIEDKARIVIGVSRGSTNQVRIYEPPTAPNGAWTQSATLDSPSARSSFGSALALDGDRLVVGASGYQFNGGAFVYTQTDGAWTLVSTLTSSGAQAPAERTAGTQPAFGTSVDLLGNRIVVGAPFAFVNNRMTGAAYVFEAPASDPDAWSFGAFLGPDDELVHNARFGMSVALDSQNVVVGALFDNGSNTGTFAGSGTTYVFEPFNDELPALTWIERAVIDAPAGSAGEFGRSVAMSGDRPVVASKDLSTLVIDLGGDPVASHDAAPASLALSAPAPNPATDRTSMTLAVEAPQHVRATLVDALGRTVRTLLDGPVADEAAIAVDVAGLAPGVYGVRVEAEGRTQTRRLTVVR